MKRWQNEIREKMTARILTFMAVRVGGTTAKEIGQFLGLTRRQASKWTTVLVNDGKLTRHGDRHEAIPRYTLPCDPLTRPLDPQVVQPSRKRWAKHDRRAKAVLAVLADGRAHSRVYLAKACGEEDATKLGPTLRRLREQGRIEFVGAGHTVKYRLVGRVRVAA